MTDHPSPAKAKLSEKIDRLPDAQRERASQAFEAIRTNHAAPSLKLDMKDGTLTIGFEADSSEVATLLQMADIGTADRDFYAGLLSQISCLGSHKRAIDSASSNFVLAVVRSVGPRDGLEALLAAQMGAIHAATMMLARRLNHVDTIQQQDAAERALNKLARTFATQMEALKRYRSTGQQKVTVEHVTVNAGGQAIVGAVETGGNGGNPLPR
jgi:hypothetical protein